MSAYRLIRGLDGAIAAGVQRTLDGAFIPNAAGNADWLAYQAWLASDNTPDAAPAASTAITVTKPQLLQALEASGDLAAVDAAVEAAGGMTKRLWDAGYWFASDDPMVVAVATEIGKTPSQILAIFQAARNY